MVSDYLAIRKANKAEYGNVGRWGRDVLVNRYDTTAHFIFEILQNAEDALKRRQGWKGTRAVRFELSKDALRIVHYGNPFTLADVKGVCGVGETTKDLTDIGRFGIGFKSVYSITNRPEVHSGAEHFAIDSFVFPTEVPSISTSPDETIFVLPLRKDDPTIHSAIAGWLRALGPRTLLFLRQIEEIVWSIQDGPTGIYLKNKVEEVKSGGRIVQIIGESETQLLNDESWLIFSREVRGETSSSVGDVEVAFLLEHRKGEKGWKVRPLDASPLVAFFPTVVATHVGFLLQGPYRTTPSRDNVPPRDPWNVSLVQETARLLIDSLETLKSLRMLDVTALQTLPLDRSRHPEGSMFAPMFELTKQALSTRALLPRAGGGWACAEDMRLARTQELRDLFEPHQLAKLLEKPGKLYWLTGDITRDTAAAIRNYLLRELNVAELTPEQILNRLTGAFLEQQEDAWIVRLYEFLSGQPALLRHDKAMTVALVRLEDGRHVVPKLNGRPQAFLPSEIKTDFPTVRSAICKSKGALQFLRAIGLTEPDAVDDVVRNVLPKYMRETVDADAEEYAEDIQRILKAFKTQHIGQRDKLLAALKDASFVMSVDLGDNRQYVSPPGDVYLATARMKELLAGVPGAMLVDDSYDCLRGEDVRDLLEACGASRSLIQERVPLALSWEMRRELRRAGGCEDMSSETIPEDHTLRCLPSLLKHMRVLSADERRERAKVLWEALRDVEQRRGSGAFTCTYTWTYYHRRQTTFDPQFVRTLNETRWVPDGNGELQVPQLISFDSLGWSANPFLASKIKFRPPIIDQLAAETGIDPKVLELLKKRGLTSVADLIAAIGDNGESDSTSTVEVSVDTGSAGEDSADGPDGNDEEPAEDENVEDALRNLLGDAPEPTGAVEDPAALDPATDQSNRVGRGSGSVASGQRESKSGGTSKLGEGHDPSGRNRSSGSKGGRSFISYVATHADEDEKDPDGLDQQQRLDLEAKAIEYIRIREPAWHPTPTHNPGFDLFQGAALESAILVCEVKAMTGTLSDRPVGLSRTQFDCATERGDSYWLYIVERAGSNDARLVRIQNPSGKAKTFTFDHGWRGAAEQDNDSPGGTRNGKD